MAIVVNLPKLNQTGKAEFADVSDNDIALKAGVEKAGEEIDAISGLTWYTPKVIATEESRTNTAYGTLTTADEIKSVVLAENGLIVIGFNAEVKESVSGAGRAAIFVGSNQLKGRTGTVTVSEAEMGTGFGPLGTLWGGLVCREALEDGSGSLVPNSPASPITTGQVVGGHRFGGPCVIHAAAGTYDVSVKYKATSGSVTAKVRKLWVATLG